jgi:hypothetical protein
MPAKHLTPALDHALLARLFRQFGSDNENERSVVIAKINGVLARSNKSWADVPALLGRGSTITVNAEIAHHVSALGSHDAGERERSRQWLNDLLIRYRKTWNDLSTCCSRPHHRRGRTAPPTPLRHRGSTAPTSR